MDLSPEKAGTFHWPEQVCRPALARRNRPLSANAMRILAAFLAAAVVALVLPALASASYGWPIRPFGQAHPVRGDLNDPRFGESDLEQSGSFHNGIDIATPDGTPVYAGAGGRVSSTYTKRVTVAAKGVSYQYWHVARVVHRGQRVKLHQLLAYVYPGYGHLHFAEVRKGEYVNPLRRGGLTPYADTTSPTIASLSYYDGSYHDLTNAAVSGTVKLTVSAFDTPQLVSNWLWAVVTPAKIGWRLFNSNGLTVTAGHWDFSSVLCRYDSLAVFAPGTLKNNSHRAGDYNYWLGAQWDTSKVQNGTYLLVVTAADIRGNQAAKSATFTVANSMVSVTPGVAAAK